MPLPVTLLSCMDNLRAAHLPLFAVQPSALSSSRSLMLVYEKGCFVFSICILETLRMFFLRVSGLLARQWCSKLEFKQFELCAHETLSLSMIFLCFFSILLWKTLNKNTTAQAALIKPRHVPCRPLIDDRRLGSGTCVHS